MTARSLLWNLSSKQDILLLFHVTRSDSLGPVWGSVLREDRYDGFTLLFGLIGLRYKTKFLMRFFSGFFLTTTRKWITKICFSVHPKESIIEMDIKYTEINERSTYHRWKTINVILTASLKAFLANFPPANCDPVWGAFAVFFHLRIWMKASFVTSCATLAQSCLSSCNISAMQWPISNYSDRKSNFNWYC